MLVRICCPCIRQNPIYKNVRCNRYLGEVDGRYHFKCDRCKGVIAVSYTHLTLPTN